METLAPSARPVGRGLLVRHLVGLREEQHRRFHRVSYSLYRDDKVRIPPSSCFLIMGKHVQLRELLRTVGLCEATQSVMRWSGQSILRSFLPTLAARHCIYQFSVWNLGITFEAQPFASAPAGVIPAGHQRQVFLAFANGQLSRRHGGEALTQFAVERHRRSVPNLKTETLRLLPPAFADETHLHRVGGQRACDRHAVQAVDIRANSSACFKTSRTFSYRLCCRAASSNCISSLSRSRECAIAASRD